MKESFKISLDNRKFEIEMFWKRSLFYWGFIAASFVGFVATDRNSSSTSIIFAAFGLLSSLIWSLGNRGSKYWQEYWERKVVEQQNLVVGDLFIDHHPKHAPLYKQFAERRLSVSKLIMGISDYAFLVWLGIIVFKMTHLLSVGISINKTWIIFAFVIVTLLYGIYLAVNCRTKETV